MSTSVAGRVEKIVAGKALQLALEASQVGPVLVVFQSQSEFDLALHLRPLAAMFSGGSLPFRNLWIFATQSAEDAENEALAWAVERDDAVGIYFLCMPDRRNLRDSQHANEIDASFVARESGLPVFITCYSRRQREA